MRNKKLVKSNGTFKVFDSHSRDSEGMFDTGQYKTWTADYGLRTTDSGIKRGPSITEEQKVDE